MNIDLDRLGKIGQDDLKDEKTQKRIFQYLYQLCEQLKYWQYHMEEENMTEELREKIEKAADPDVKTMSTSVTDEGIEVRDKDGNVVLTIGETGDITAGSVTTGDLTVGGQGLGSVLEAFLGQKIIVSETQPDAHGVIWVQPQTAGSGTAQEVRYKVTGAYAQITGANPPAIPFTFTREGSDAARGLTCKYGIRFRVRNEGMGRAGGYLNHVKVQVTGEDANGNEQTVTILDEDRADYAGARGYFTVDTLETGSGWLDNVTYGGTATVNITMAFSDSGTRTIPAEEYILAAEGDGGGQQAEVRDCAVKYIS